MNVESIREYCLSKPGSFDCFPFDEETLVFKVVKKIFAIVPLEKKGRIALKCDPERAIELREHYDGITPGWHLSKKHWNDVDFQIVDGPLVRELIDHSYALVAKSLKKVDRETLESLE